MFSPLTGPQGEIIFAEERYSDDQPRDENGRFAGGDSVFAHEPDEDAPATWGSWHSGTPTKESVALKDLIPTQADKNPVTGQSLKEEIEHTTFGGKHTYNEEHTPKIVVVRQGGKLYIADGHHRAGAALLDGKTRVDALVYEAESKRFSEDQPRDKDGKFSMGNVATFKSEADGISAHVTSFNGRYHVHLMDDDAGQVLPQSSIHSGEGAKEKAVEHAKKLVGLRFSEDQPRDPDGKFASGGSLKIDGKETTVAEFIKEGMSDHEAMSVVVRNRAREMDFPIDKVNTVAGRGRDFEVAGHAYKEAGHASFSGVDAGKITIYTEGLSHIGVGGLVAHEVEHIRFQEVLNDYHGEMQHLSNLATHDHETYDSITTPNGYLDPEKGAYAVFPTATEIEPYLSRNGEQLAKEDGVTAYSRAYWEGYQKGAVPREIAIHETLAEMARLKYEDKKNNTPDNPLGKLVVTEKPTKLWNGLFKAVNKIAKEKGYGYSK